MKFKIEESRRDDNTEGQLTGHSGTSFITRGTEGGHLLTTTLRFPNDKGQRTPKPNSLFSCTQDMPRIPAHRICPEFLPAIFFPNDLGKYSNIDYLSSLPKA